MLVLKTMAGGSTGGNGARGRRVTIMKSNKPTGNGARRRVQPNRLHFYSKMLTLASETSIFARTAEINCHYLMTLSVLRYAV